MDFVVRPRLGFEPNADVFLDEERGQILVAVEAAGADPDSLRVAIDDRYLLITGSRTETVRLRRGSFIQKEIAYGTFAKRLLLPVAVDFLGEATATYAEGMLVISLPVSPEAYVPTVRTEIRMILKRSIS